MSKSKKPLTNKAGEVRELTLADMRAMRPAREVLPSELATVLPKRRPGQRGPQKALRKVPVNVRLSPEVVAKFKATGAGWQTRIDEALKEWLAKRRG